VWKLLSFCVGLCLVYLGAFIYESEQKKLQNRLEDWWLRIDDLNTAGLKRRAAFMVVIAQITTSGFDAMFGPRLMSLSCLGTSMAYTLGYLCLLFAALRFAGLAHAPGPAPSVGVQALWGLVFLLLASVRPLVPRLARFQFWWTMVAFGLVIAIYGPNLRWASGMSPESPGSFTEAPPVARWIIYGGGIGLTMMAAITFIALTRWLVRWSAASASFMRIVTLLLANLSLALGIVIVPGILLAATLKPSSPWPLMWALVLLGNTLIALVAMAFFLLAVLMLIHQLFWPLLARPLYLIANERLLMHRTALVSVGLTLMGTAVPGIPAFLKEIVS
jgi:hypothetical protein